MPSTLIIPDVHERIDKLRSILATWNGPAVLLGDLLDDFHSTPGSRRDTVEFIETYSANPRLTFLWGNHDLQYAFPKVRALRCSGWNPSTQELVSRQLNWPDHWSHWKLSTEVEGWFLSHAGAAMPGYLYPEVQSMALDRLRSGYVGNLLAPGKGRGGKLDRGGLTWQDWDMEFEPLGSCRQIVGHSPSTKPRWKGNNLCLDTNLTSLAIVCPDGRVQVMGVDDFLDGKREPLTV